MEALLVLLGFVVLNLAAARWARDSRDGFSPTAGRDRHRF